MLGPWLALLRARLRWAGLRHNDAIVGMRATGHLTTAPWCWRPSTTWREGATEFYFHPAVTTTAGTRNHGPGYDRQGELAALTSPAVAQKLKVMGLKPIGFSDLVRIA